KVACGIISIRKIMEKGGKVIMDENNAKIINNSITLTTAPRNGRSYTIPIHSVNAEHMNAIKDTDIMALHITLGHVNARKIRNAIKEKAFDDLPVDRINGVIKTCNVCIATKMKKST